MLKKNLRSLNATLVTALAFCATVGLMPAMRGGNLVAASAVQQGKGIVCLSVAFVEDQYDKMGDKTVVKFNPILVKEFPSREIGVFADFSYPGRTFSRPTKLTLGFVHAALSETLNSGFSGSHDVTLTIGTEQVAQGATAYNNKEQTTLSGAKVQVETMSLELQSSVFARIANASTVSVRLGQTEFTLEDKQLKALRKMVERAQIN